MAKGVGCVCYYAVYVLILVLFSVTTDSRRYEESHVEYLVSKSQPDLFTVIHTLGNLNKFRYRRQAVSESETDKLSGQTGTSADVTSMPTPSVTSLTTSRIIVTSAEKSSTNSTVTLKSVATTPGGGVSVHPPTTFSTSTPATTKRVSTVTSTTKPVTDDSSPVIQQDNHNYYASTIIPESSSKYFVELVDPNSHDTLNYGHRVAVTITLPFKFRFYGHNISSITVATGGFLYASPFLHQWLTATQYIAPLMANFDTSFNSDSSIFYKQVGDAFIIEWHNVLLQDQHSAGPFVFQAQLKQDGTIRFIYKSMPLPLTNISTVNHPVKIGLSDAFYNDTFLPQYGIRRRTIYEYHRVSFTPEQVEEGTVIILTPLPTCNLINDCKICTRHENVNFECKWCETVSRCSDGFDWQRQDWIEKGCDKVGLESDGVKCKSSRSQDSSKASLIAIVIILVIILASSVGWVFYAYTHPTSPSGIWLMEHRPSQMKAKLTSMKFWKSSSPAGTKYTVETEA